MCIWMNNLSNIIKISITFQLLAAYKKKFNAASWKFPQSQEISAASGHKAARFILSVGGHCNKNLSRIIFKARSHTLDIKTQQKWKYADSTCIGCKIQVETGEEILFCEILNTENRLADIPVTYDSYLFILFES